MKTYMTKPLIALVVLTLGFAAFAQDEPQPRDTNEPPEEMVDGTTPNEGTNADNEQLVGDLIQAVTEAQQATDAQANGTNGRPDPRSIRPIRGQGPRGTTGSGTNSVSLTTLVARNGTNQNAGTTDTLRLNFRNAPLSLVLDYLSEAAGFTISPNSKVDLKGTVTVWSNRPMNRTAAVALLHKALGEYNYGATVENGNLLNIYVVDPSNTEIFAGITNNNDYTTIPATKDLVTQIVYVSNVEANQLIQSLQPLMPTGTSMTANQGANAIVITDTKANIRRMAQLVKALDTSSVSAAGTRVFPLDYADATALAQVVTQLFQSNDSSQAGRNNRGGFPGGGFPGFGGFGGGGGRGGDNNSSASTQAGRVAAAKVTAVADERSNSLVVSASADQMLMVEELVKQMDVNVDDLTELRVFRLRYADPQETADQLANLFPDPTLQQNSRGQGFRGFGPFGNFGGNNSRTTQSSRSTKQTRVTAVADPRTGSVIVSASRETMGQIAGIVEELDSDPSKKKKVHVIKVENRDPQEVVEELQSIIATDTSAGTLNNNRNTTRQTGSQLNSRQQNNLQNQRNNQGSFGSGQRQLGQ